MKKIDFKEQYEKSQDIINELEEFLKKVIFMQNVRSIDNQTIYEYGKCFHASISKLNEIANALHLKAEIKSNISYKDYNDLVNQYNQNEQDRLSLANKLNEFAKEYF